VKNKTTFHLGWFLADVLVVVLMIVLLPIEIFVWPLGIGLAILAGKLGSKAFELRRVPK
jgi:hypothetical protein